MTRIKVNGEDAELRAATVAELLAERGIDPSARFLAVAVNGTVVRRGEWAGRALLPGDSVEIVRPMQGG
jgi:sulfur carrier protein